MSGCCDDTPECNPCEQVASTEGLSSQIQNLTLALLGTFTKTITNGRAVWSAQCDPYSLGLACMPKSASEGFICYLLRVLQEMPFFKGDYNALLPYCKNSFVVSGGNSYISILDVPAGQAPPNATYWKIAVTGNTGPAGPQGPPGPPGAGAAPTYAHRTVTSTVTLTNSDDVIFCEPAGVMDVTFPASSGLDDGKRYKIWTTGAAAVTIQKTGGDVIDSPLGLGGSTYPMTLVGESVEFVLNKSAGKWRLM